MRRALRSGARCGAAHAPSRPDCPPLRKRRRVAPSAAERPLLLWPGRARAVRVAARRSPCGRLRPVGRCRPLIWHLLAPLIWQIALFREVQTGGRPRHSSRSHRASPLRPEPPAADAYLNRGSAGFTGVRASPPPPPPRARMWPPLVWAANHPFDEHSSHKRSTPPPRGGTPQATPPRTPPRTSGQGSSA
eukprot:4096746-Prymnesium_polylepis.1